MKKEILYNKKSREILLKELQNESFKRITCSFYRYTTIKELEKFRDTLYREWSTLKIYGRIYIAEEGINAQLSCPEQNWELFKNNLQSHNSLKEIIVKVALEEGESFYKLTIKIKDEIVAYGIDKNEYDMDITGHHLSAKSFNEKLKDKNSLVVDMRNYYESEVGHFDNAIIPDVDTSRDLLPEVKNLLKGHEKDEVLLYCTGGIRCEKASSYLIKSGFQNVNQLKGGIIQYSHDIKKEGLNSKFIGKNFVFDARLSERVTEDILSFCHQCGEPADQHLDCGNDACHILFIQCDKCNLKYSGCCSTDCQDFASLPIEEQRVLRKDPKKIVSKARYSSRVKPKLNKSDYL
ncbi:MAG: rhodanese-related sulfurtransferase [Candidatus Marinimicrobia bacterium]|nr:rhodanese-related sulfurtransferase [Candidatus Neomarinimicrobiota bacterium]